MKSQDVGLLLKLVSLQKRKFERHSDKARKAWPDDWRDWDPEGLSESDLRLLGQSLHAPDHVSLSSYTARGLALETGISKSQINLALNRCTDVGLVKLDRELDVPRANSRALFEFIVYGLKYVFPAKPGALTRGIATAFAAPILREKLMSAGDYMPVWPDARGNTKGLAVEPLFKTATYAVKRDPEMYAMLALVDAIRIGQPRERSLAIELLKEHLELPK